MATVLFFFVLFVIGVFAIGILEPVMRRLLPAAGIPKDVVQALFIGAGALVALPFVLSILAEVHVSILASLIVGAVILFHAGASFAYAMFRLVYPLARVPLSKKR
jgi:hypothetical protein